MRVEFKNLDALSHARDWICAESVVQIAALGILAPVVPISGGMQKRTGAPANEPELWMMRETTDGRA